MYDGSQIQDNRDERNASALRNNCKELVDSREFFSYHCNKCHKIIKRSGQTPEYTHEQHIADCWPGGVDGIDYVECKLCKFAGMRIAGHVKNVHKFEKNEYERLYGKTNCVATIKRYSNCNKKNGDWITRKKADGVDLSDYKSKMSKSVSNAIMSNPDERKRRSILLGKLNQTDVAKKRSSDSAIRTSARPEILEARSKKLAEWRLREPEKFYENCISKLIAFKTSKPEKWLRDWVQNEFIEYEFKGNQQLKASCFVLNKTKRRQIDIMSKSHKIIIEVDGILHFRNIESWNQLELCRKKDQELNDGAFNMGYVVIRVGYDTWEVGTGEVKKEYCDLIKKIIIDAKPGVYKLGKVYECQI